MQYLQFFFYKNGYTKAPKYYVLRTLRVLILVLEIVDVFCEVRTKIEGSVNNLTLSLLMSYTYGAPCKARNFNVVYIYIYGPTFGNAESRLFLFTAHCFNIESMQKLFLCHSCV
jgi:hypothetical protein